MPVHHTSTAEAGNMTAQIATPKPKPTPAPTPKPKPKKKTK